MDKGGSAALLLADRTFDLSKPILLFPNRASFFFFFLLQEKFMKLPYVEVKLAI